MEKVNSWCMYKSVYFNQYSISKYQLKMDLFFWLIKIYYILYLKFFVQFGEKVKMASCWINQSIYFFVKLTDLHRKKIRHPKKRRKCILIQTNPVLKLLKEINVCCYWSMCYIRRHLSHVFLCCFCKL